MRSGLCLAVFTVALWFAATAARAEDCPAKSTRMDDIIAVLNQSDGCDRAMKVFEACAFGSSADVQFGTVVEKKCEADFLSRLGAQQKLAYGREMGVCDRKYRNESGTMYLSSTAFCRAEVSQRYSRQALKAAGPKAR